MNNVLLSCRKGVYAAAMARQPHILYILVDEMRYPMHFPPEVITPDMFMKTFMPHTYEHLWAPGVRFINAFTSASDCTPARSSIVTGLYTQQTFCMTTRANPNDPQGDQAPQPPLNTAFPTYGKLLRNEGYDTPYIGKWHISDCPEDDSQPYLEPYGFDDQTRPDPVSFPGQGWGSTAAAAGKKMPFGDPTIANQAVAWMQQRDPSGKPFCLTVGFGNPHDKQFFWGGIEVSRFRGLYGSETPMLKYNTNIPHQAAPPPCGYPMPKNWQSVEDQQITLHQVFREFFARAVGDTSENEKQRDFTKRQTTNTKVSGDDSKIVAVAPWSYWLKGLDMYTQAMHDVDEQIAQVVENIPQALKDDMVVIFMSDHGEYAGSHGLQGKGFTVYEETMRIPLTFSDFTSDHRYTSGNQNRLQFASSVDILPLFVTLGHGDTGWMDSDDVRGLYETRNNLLAVIQHDTPVIRDYVVFACDEVMTTTDNYLNAPGHVLAYRDNKGKVGVYSHWAEGKAQPLPGGQEFEYYNYQVADGLLELNNQPELGTEATQRLLQVILPQEIQRPMPNAILQQAQQEALQAYWKYVIEADLTTAGHRLAHML
jgi:arylsulfatase A-like enzyme